jgi:diguanylate cyclase (GGDEF)-like protein
MYKNLALFRTISLKIWIPVILSVLFPLVAYPLLSSSLANNIQHHYINDMIWSIYILPPIAFAYFFEIRGAIISSILLQIIHISFEYYFHINSLSIEVMVSMLIQLILTFTISYTVGLMSKSLKLNKLKLEQAYKNIEKLAFYDPLTGVANRCMLLKSLELEINRHKKTNNQLAVLFLDLDGFKQVNDDFGHDAGDIILTEVVKRFNGCIRQNDMLARFGGDEFIVLLPRVSSLEAASISEKLLKVIQQPFLINNNKVRITTSVGITFYKNESDTAEALIKQADVSMYQAKKLGKNKYQIYYPTLEQIPKEG